MNQKICAAVGNANGTKELSIKTSSQPSIKTNQNNIQHTASKKSLCAIEAIFFSQMQMKDISDCLKTMKIVLHLQSPLCQIQMSCCHVS